MAIEAIYTAQATATGGRNGHVRSSDGLLDIDVRTPKEMGGPGTATNPEQMFAAGYAACFDSALSVVIQKEKAPVTATQVDAAVGIGPNGKGGYGLEVKLDVTLSGVTQQQADDLVAKAHAVCPYSNAITGNVDVILNAKAA